MIDPQDYRIEWVHGIGPTQAGFSASWTQAFNQYLNFPLNDFIEGLWATVFANMMTVLGLNEARVPLTPQEQGAADNLSNALVTVLQARASALRSGPALFGEWQDVAGREAKNVDLLPPWVLDPGAYIGEFAQYLVSRRIRSAVKEKVKEKIRPLAGSGDDISIIAHSWGTVVAYESLIDLEVELPAFQLTNLFTLGSPLWLVQPFLDDRSGRKPGNLTTWVNVHAQDDVIGSWLRPGFRVDKDFEVPNFGGGEPHGSYFVPGNVAVQRDIVAATIVPPQAFSSDLLLRRETQFTLWRPSIGVTPPVLVIGTFAFGNPNTLANRKDIPLSEADPGTPGLWAIAVGESGLPDGIYHYWFQVENTNPADPAAALILCTDPFATTVDWRLLSPSLPAGFNNDTDRQPASVIRLRNGHLSAIDPGGETTSFPDDPKPDTLPANNHLVIYELPAAWTRVHDTGTNERGVGTFKDVLALVDEAASGANFEGLDVLNPGRSYLTELGVNALELLPPTDSFFKRAWGYDTAHFLAPDWELGFPDGQAASTSNADLAALVQSCHHHGIRFFIDVVMAFGRNEAYQWIDFDDFYIADPSRHPADPDALTSRRGDGRQRFRDGFGSAVFRYTRPTPKPSYDPISGNTGNEAPARALMYTYLTRWMRDFRIDGIRMDSVENVANWDFVGKYKDRARNLWNERWQRAGLAPAGADERFLVVGEELSLPLGLLTQRRLDGLWNDGFRARIRAAILGQNNDGENFEFTVRNAIDCRNLGFTYLAQCVNYVTSHDVEGFRKERLFTMLQKSGFGGLDLQKRVQLAFVCLLTANGIPMFLAGEEFADQNDLFDSKGNVTEAGGKEVDPVDFTRLQEPWRHAIFEYVSRLVHLRTSHPALGVTDTDFIQVDFSDNKRVLVWRRGMAGQDPVIVVANFSDYATPNGLTDPNAEYVVPNWPSTPPGRHWREVTQRRDVLPAQTGREPIFSWEAKVYTLA